MAQLCGFLVNLTVRIKLNWTPSHMLLASSQPCRHFGQHRFAINRNKECMYVKSSHHVYTHVFIRNNAVRKPLQQPYNGPYKVLQRTAKHFTVDINGRHDTVLLDRLKPENSKSTACEILHPKPDKSNASTPRITRSGRHASF